jgi:type II secretory pathway pseudopilin PulG
LKWLELREEARVRNSARAGSVLLEVVLAIVLFAAAAAVIGMGLKASIDGAQRLRLSTHAGNLAVTVISELQMGLRSLADTGPEAFGPPFEGWVWEVAALPWGQGQAESATRAATLMQVEVTVRYEPEGFVHRLAQVIDARAVRSGDAGLPDVVGVNAARSGPRGIGTLQQGARPEP